MGFASSKANFGVAGIPQFRTGVGGLGGNFRRSVADNLQENFPLQLREKWDELPKKVVRCTHLLMRNLNNGYMMVSACASLPQKDSVKTQWACPKRERNRSLIVEKLGILLGDSTMRKSIVCIPITARAKKEAKMANFGGTLLSRASIWIIGG